MHIDLSNINDNPLFDEEDKWLSIQAIKIQEEEPESQSSSPSLMLYSVMRWENRKTLCKTAKQRATFGQHWSRKTYSYQRDPVFNRIFIRH